MSRKGGSQTPDRWLKGARYNHTCFGLVEQNYELPEAVLKEMGVEIVPINRAKVGTATVDRTQPTSNIKRSVYETINITVLRRGIIGVNKIGYVL